MLFTGDRLLPAPYAAAERRVWRTASGLVLFWSCIWILATVLLWAAQSRLVFMTGESRAFTAPFDPRIFHERTLIDADGLRLQSVVLIHDTNRDRYWILFCPPAGASTRVKRI